MSNRKAIYFICTIFILLAISACKPKQVDSEESQLLKIVPAKQLTAEELELLNDTARCIINTPMSRLTIRVDTNLNPFPPPRGYLNPILKESSSRFLEFLDEATGSYDEFFDITFYNRDYESSLKSGVYMTYTNYSSSSYGTGGISISATYMYNGFWGDRSLYPLPNQKIYVKSVSIPSPGLEIIFCDVKMRWEYSSWTTWPVTVNGKLFVPR